MFTHTLQAPPHAMDSALRCQLHVWPAHQKEATQQRCPGLRRGAPASEPGRACAMACAASLPEKTAPSMLAR